MASKRPEKSLSAIASALAGASADASAIAGGPVSVPLARAAALWLLPWMCEPECRVGARVEARGKQTALYVTPGDTRDALRILHEFSEALATVESGQLELIAAASAEVASQLAGDDDAGEDGGNQTAELKARRIAAARFRLAGKVENGMWHVHSAFPPVSAQDLRQALQILDLVDSSTQAWARDDEEAQAIAALAAKSTGFIRTNPAQVRANTLEIRATNIAVMDNRRPYLALVLFRLRMGDGPWDLRTHQQWDEKFLADQMEFMRTWNEQMLAAQRKHHAPRLDTLLETPTAVYWQTDFPRILFGAEDMGVAALLWKRIDKIKVDSMVTFTAAITHVDLALGALGYQWLGDYQHSKCDPREAYRVFAGSKDGAFALWGIVAGTYRMQWMFFSLLGEDFWVTTTTFKLPDGAPRPARSSHRKVDTVSMADHAAAHAAHVAEHVAEGKAHPSPGTMAEFLPIIDRFNASLR